MLKPTGYMFVRNPLGKVVGYVHLEATQGGTGFKDFECFNDTS